MEAVIYTRVSSDRSGRARSVTEQEADCRAVCEREDWAVRDVLVDNDAGASRWSRKDRPAYRQLAALLRGGGVGVLVTWEASRAQRDLSAYVQLRDLCAEQKVLWSYGGRTYDFDRYDDRLSTGLDALLSEREADVTRERVVRALRSRRDAGAPHGKLAYGYRRVIDPSTGETIGRVPDETTAPLVREMCRRALTGETTYAIAKGLNARGIYAPRMGRDGKPVEWTPPQVKRMVVSPTYAALRTYKGAVTGPATWEPLITMPDHLTLVAKLNDPSRRTQRDSIVKHLLVGIAVCGVCGAPCRRIKNRSCPSYSCSRNHCVARAQHLADGYVTAVAVARLNRPDLADLLAGDDSAANAALDEARALRARLDSFYDSAAAGEITPAALARIEAGLLPKIETAERKATPSTASPLLAMFTAGDAEQTWAALSIPQRRDLLRVLLTPVIHRTRQGARQLDPESIEIAWKGQP
jgi:site-specific DNA recombinase